MKFRLTFSKFRPFSRNIEPLIRTFDSLCRTFNFLLMKFRVPVTKFRIFKEISAFCDTLSSYKLYWYYYELYWWRWYNELDTGIKQPEVKGRIGIVPHDLPLSSTQRGSCSRREHVTTSICYSSLVYSFNDKKHMKMGRFSILVTRAGRQNRYGTLCNNLGQRSLATTVEMLCTTGRYPACRKT